MYIISINIWVIGVRPFESVVFFVCVCVVFVVPFFCLFSQSPDLREGAFQLVMSFFKGHYWLLLVMSSRLKKVNSCFDLSRFVVFNSFIYLFGFVCVFCVWGF